VKSLGRNGKYNGKQAEVLSVATVAAKVFWAGYFARIKFADGHTQNASPRSLRVV
jgi:hypothetical protein